MRERGAVLLFMLVLIAVLAFFVDRLLPAREAHLGPNKQRAIDSLNQICFDIRDYQYDRKALPANTNTLEDANLGGKYMNSGLMANPSTWEGFLVHDPFGRGNVYFQDSHGSPLPPGEITYRRIWSVGPNGQDDTRGSDDISRVQYNLWPGRARTRRLLDIIRAAKSSHNVSLTGTWAGSANRRGDCYLGPEFDKDGWNSNFVLRAGQVMSIGPNKVNNAGAGDDVSW